MLHAVVQVIQIYTHEYTYTASKEQDDSEKAAGDAQLSALNQGSGAFFTAGMSCCKTNTFWGPLDSQVGLKLK